MSDDSQSSMDPNLQFGYADEWYSNSSQLELLVSEVFDDIDAGDTKGSTSGLSEVDAKEDGDNLRDSVHGESGKRKEARTLDMNALGTLLDNAKNDNSFETVSAQIKQAIEVKFVDLEASATREREKISGIGQNLKRCAERTAGTGQKLLGFYKRCEEAGSSVPREFRIGVKRCIEEIAGFSAEIDRAAKDLKTRELDSSKLVQNGASLASSEAERVLKENKTRYVSMEHIVDLFFP